MYTDPTHRLVMIYWKLGPDVQSAPTRTVHYLTKQDRYSKWVLFEAPIAVHMPAYANSQKVGEISHTCRWLCET